MRVVFWEAQVALFMLAVVFLFWLIYWRPYTSLEDNYLSIALAGFLCIVAGLEIFIVSTLTAGNTRNGKREVSFPVVEEWAVGGMEYVRVCARALLIGAGHVPGCVWDVCGMCVVCVHACVCS
jgi:hypothetical protein